MIRETAACLVSLARHRAKPPCVPPPPPRDPSPYWRWMDAQHARATTNPATYPEGTRS